MLKKNRSLEVLENSFRDLENIQEAKTKGMLLFMMSLKQLSVLNVAIGYIILVL